MKFAFFATTITLSIVISSPAIAGITAKQERDAFIASDADSNRVLSKTEFKTFLRKMAKLGHEKAREAVLYGPAGIQVGFKRVDANADGKLTPEELRKFK